MRDLLLATTNKGKLVEFASLLPGHLVRVRSASEVLSPMRVVVEDGVTFAENAQKKAIAIARESMCLTLADDSGLEVDALDGKPGVYSARFSGDKATDESNRAELLKRLRQLPSPAAPFSARFRCALCLVDPFAAEGHQVTETAGVCEGSIVLVERGTGGFGYDAVFVPVGYSQTFGELSAEAKHALSHRGKATEALLPLLVSLLGAT